MKHAFIFSWYHASPIINPTLGFLSIKLFVTCFIILVAFLAQVRNAADNYSSIYLFRYSNMRNEKFKELREELQASTCVS